MDSTCPNEAISVSVLEPSDSNNDPTSFTDNEVRVESERVKEDVHSSEDMEKSDEESQTAVNIRKQTVIQDVHSEHKEKSDEDAQAAVNIRKQTVIQNVHSGEGKEKSDEDAQTAVNIRKQTAIQDVHSSEDKEKSDEDAQTAVNIRKQTAIQDVHSSEGKENSNQDAQTAVIIRKQTAIQDVHSSADKENSDQDAQTTVIIRKQTDLCDDPGTNKPRTFLERSRRSFWSTIHVTRRSWASSMSSLDTQSYFTVPKPWQKKSNIYQIYVASLLSMKKGTLLSLISMLLCMINEMHPSCPRFGMILAVMTLFLYTSEKQRERHSIFYAQFCILGMASIVMDIDWLSSCYDIAPIDKSADYENYDFAPSMGCTVLPLIGHISWWALLLNVPVKAVMILITVRKAKTGQSFLWAIWKRFHLFCPPCTSRNPKDVHSTIQSRVIAIEWIEVTCATAMLLLTLYVYLQLGWSVQFNYPAPFISLKVIMLIKGFSGLLVFGSSIKNTDFLSFLSEFGCRPSCKSVRDRRDESNEKVIVDEDFLCFNGFTKIADLVIGAGVWVEVIWAIVQLGDWKSDPKPIQVVLGAVIVLQFFTDILVMVLAITVIR